MINFFHNNVSMNATSKYELYKIWDDDLKNKIKKRIRWEWIFGFVLIVVVVAETLLVKSAFIGISIFCALKILKFFIEEAHVNYLMHSMDIQEMSFLK